jgi:hypothetical protein
MIDQLQSLLEDIYGIRSELRAERFLVTREEARALGGTGRAPEELLVAEDEEGMEVALYLAPELVAQVSALGSDLPVALEHGDALGSFCILAEGVSHFLYLSRALALERHLSLLELEAQAEVDKFALCLLLKWPSEGWGEQLHERLFDAIRYRPGLSPSERWRYQEANRLSRNYCQGLLPHVRARRRDRLLSDLRYTYRLGAEAKLQHLSRRREMVRAG